MLFTHNLLRFIRLTVKTLNIFGTYPYSMNFDTNKLSFSKHNGLIRQNLKHIGFLIFSLVGLIQLIHYKSKFPQGVFFESIVFTVTVPAQVILVDVYLRKSYKVVELFNLIVTFERKLLHGNLQNILQSLNLFVIMSKYKYVCR